MIPLRLLDLGGTKIVFAMIRKGQHLLFEETKTANLSAEDTPKWDLEDVSHIAAYFFVFVYLEIYLVTL